MKNKIHLIMPMGGKGSRFENHGFQNPKPLINIYKKPFFYWSTMSILKFVDVIDLRFVVLKEHIEKFEIDKKIHNYFPEAKIIVLDHVLNGPVLTCMEGIKDIEDDYPIIFNDCDHLFKSTQMNESIINGRIEKISGALVTFKSNKPQYSYVKYDNDKVSGTIEKVVASNDAICGAYLFRSASQIKKLAEDYFSNCEYKEYFISGLYNIIARNGGLIDIYDTDYHVTFGIPEEYEEAIKDTHYKELDL